MIQQNAEIPLPSQLQEVADDPDGEAVGRMLVRAEIPKRWIRINLSMAENLVSKIDLAAQSLGMSRSGYLAEAARRMLLQS
ncbi:MAG: hypothetical protein G8345_05325 [Magnetococcales bacterium]|nr:hypothetical protein [Magnetococcales bacterium]